LTPHTQYDVGAFAPVDDSAGAGAPEPELTPKMMNAALDILGQYDPKYDSARETVVCLFIAMKEAFI
jgi:hypothetical protein